jgi:hypothetical protein
MARYSSGEDVITYRSVPILQHIQPESAVTPWSVPKKRTTVLGNNCIFDNKPDRASEAVENGSIEFETKESPVQGLEY